MWQEVGAFTLIVFFVSCWLISSSTKAGCTKDKKDKNNKEKREVGEE